MFIFTVIIFIGSLGWVFFEPGWEPSLFSIASFSAMISFKNHVRKCIKNKINAFRSKKIFIENGLISDTDEKILEIIRPLCLGENVLFKCTNLDALRFKKDSMNQSDNDDVRFYKKSKSDNLIAKSKLVESAIVIISDLYKSHLICIEMSDIPQVIRNFVKITYPNSNGKPSFSIDGETTSFDIYSNSISDGKIFSFVADFPDDIIKKTLAKLSLKNINELAIPYNYSVLQLPEEAFNKYVLPAQVYSVLSVYKEYKEDYSFWVSCNWAFGPH
ncbi:hypothetical protein PSH47_19905 [Pseudoalteromonas sp. CST5]|uniref:hypothetical protein n=1 Tax=unclassified Pseudoalteromonas TaxID=194690 RepID=UPI00235859C3|nr:MULTISPECIES: hypothetical protein [unclassified Pseudoalteromonas]MDC9515411.1 hypothetical protein [Pseudoalteromonas sp. CST1]MDC9539731.1 hypothetical protein [Pseudoalteromonas sp. CST3]MDC9543611.1 hypothetical protein [Pseudoalteromonas sp. CST2]MDC9547421.1 hypothetical protein [Pseudoalteromonas sp. CST4]MDC9551393.1 hypothetical protein [Pseudoalteromonas sp. CST5]